MEQQIRAVLFDMDGLMFDTERLGDEKGFEWIGAYDITADELLAGTDTAKTESKIEHYEKMLSNWDDLMTICEMAEEEDDDSMLEELKTGFAALTEDMVGSVKPSTLACYRRNIQCHILPALGECVAAELTAAEINDYIQQLQEDYSPKLVREIGGLLLRIVGMAGVGYGEDVTLPKVRQKAVEVFTEPELKQMGQVILRRPDRTGVGVLLTAYTGLRLGELCGLQWQDVDVGAGLLHIQRTVERIAQIGGGTCLTVQPPKTENSERWIPIPKEMLRMLKPETKQPDSYLLTGGEIVPDPRAMQYRYKVLLERCGVRYRNFHCLRHSYATRCVERGVDVKSVSELLGHADVRTTLRLYVHSSMDYKRRAVEGIGFLKGIT